MLALLFSSLEGREVSLSEGGRRGPGRPIHGSAGRSVRLPCQRVRWAVGGPVGKRTNTFLEPSEASPRHDGEHPSTMGRARPTEAAGSRTALRPLRGKFREIERTKDVRRGQGSSGDLGRKEIIHRDIAERLHDSRTIWSEKAARFLHDSDTNRPIILA